MLFSFQKLEMLLRSLEFVWPFPFHMFCILGYLLELRGCFQNQKCHLCVCLCLFSCLVAVYVLSLVFN